MRRFGIMSSVSHLELPVGNDIQQTLIHIQKETKHSPKMNSFFPPGSHLHAAPEESGWSWVT